MEIYVSTDIEADGPIPGPNSMLSFGSAAYTAGKGRSHLLSHGLGGVQSQHYDRHTYWPEKRQALKKWAAYLAKLKGGKMADAAESKDL
jgi:hypothetical protein